MYSAGISWQTKTITTRTSAHLPEEGKKDNVTLILHWRGYWEHRVLRKKTQSNIMGISSHVEICVNERRICVSAKSYEFKKLRLFTGKAIYLEFFGTEKILFNQIHWNSSFQLRSIIFTFEPPFWCSVIFDTYNSHNL